MTALITVLSTALLLGTTPAHGAPRELAITPLLGPKGGNPGNIPCAH